MDAKPSSLRHAWLCADNHHYVQITTQMWLTSGEDLNGAFRLKRINNGNM